MKRIYTFLLILACSLIINAQSSRYAEHSVLASGKWAKIRVRNEGVYQLSSSSLKSMGFSNPGNVRLYGYNRAVLPETLIEKIEDDLVEIPLYRGKKDGSLLFYSVGTTRWTRKSEYNGLFSHLNNPYSNYIYYFLTENADSAPSEFKEVESTSKNPTTQNTYYAHALYEKDEYSFINAGRTFFDSYEFNAGSSKTYTLDLPNLTTCNLILTTRFAAAGKQTSKLIVSARANTKYLALDTITYSYLTDYEYATVSDSNRTCKIKDFSENKVNVTLKHTSNGAVTGHLDYIKACYTARLALNDASYLTFGPDRSGSTAFNIAGASGNTVVWNVSSPDKTYKLKSTTNKDTITAIADNARINDRFVAVNTDKSFPSPEYVGTIRNQDLHSLSDIDYVIIVPANGKLTAQAQRIADIHHEKEGLNCFVVTADQLYNEFSSGTPDATAYRRFMKMLYDKASSSSDPNAIYPNNLLLFGSCFWDNRFITSGMTKKSQDDYLLCYESDNSWSHMNSYVLEDYFGILKDGVSSNPVNAKYDIGIGRIPVSTETDARNVVNKLISYINNENSGSWKNTICFMADDGNSQSDADDHIMAAEYMAKEVEAKHPDYRIRKIYWDAYTRQQTATGNTYPEAKDDINKTMKEGALIMNYMGHGAAYCLSHEQLMRTEDFTGWTAPYPPLWLTAACDVTPIDMNTKNIGEEAILNKTGAAIGFIGTTRTVIGIYNDKLNKRFMKNVIDNTDYERYTVGAALALAKNQTCDASSQSLNNSKFILIGDPALILTNPSYKVKVDRIIDNNGNETTVLSAGDVVTVEGHVEDERKKIADDFQGIVCQTVFDNKEHIVCKNNAGWIDEEAVPEFDSYTRKLYQGSDSIRNGYFSITFPVALDNNYSNEPGLINLYALNNTKSIEANGSYTDFVIGGTILASNPDTIGPSIETLINSRNTIDGEKVNDTPTIYINLSDSSGINATGNGIGHDIVAILDGKESATYNLNGYFVQTAGDYTSGKIEFTFPTIEPGKHVLTIRAFDIRNNMSEKNYSFEVYANFEKVVEYYDFAGRLIAKGENPSLPKGTYIKKTRYLSDGEEITHTTSKEYSK